MRLTSSVVDSLNTSLLSDAVSPNGQLENPCDKSGEPELPGVPVTAHAPKTNACTSSSVTIDPICSNDRLRRSENIDLSFVSKGLHLCNLNVQHILPKLDELRVLLANRNGPDIFGACETFLEPEILDNQIAIEGYDFLLKDRAAMGVVLFYILEKILLVHVVQSLKYPNWKQFGLKLSFQMLNLF